METKEKRPEQADLIFMVKSSQGEYTKKVSR